MKKKKILVAGGTGLLGSSLTNILSKKNYLLTSSYLTRKPIKKLKKKYKRYDFLKYNDCLKATKNKDVVIVSAVKAGGIKHLKYNPTENLIDNIKIRINLFQAALQNKVKKVIWISSSTVYQPLKKKISEKKLNFNLDPYQDYLITGNVYRFLESIIKFYKSKGVDMCIVRTSSIYGPNDNFNPAKSHVIPALIKKIFDSKQKEIEIWGNPNVVRDFVYVDDLAKAVILLINKKIDRPINFSYGKGYTIINLVRLLIKLSGKKVDFKFNNINLSSAPFRVLDNKYFNKVFKKFKRTNIEDGLKKTINWYLNEKKKY